MPRSCVIRIRPAAVALLCLTLVRATEGTQGQEAKRAYEGQLEHLRANDPKEFQRVCRLATFTTEMLLARLGYGVGPFDGVLDSTTASALRKYEEDRGLPISADPLSFETGESIRRDEAFLAQEPPFLPGKHLFTDLWDSGYVKARGTWIIVGSEMAFPQQTTSIQCSREEGTCVEATANLRYDEAQARLALDVDTYEIERWDQHEIVTKPLQFGCTRYVKRITRLQKGVSGIRSTISADGLCEGVSGEEMYLALVDGSEVYLPLYRAYLSRWRDMAQISPDLIDESTADSSE